MKVGRIAILISVLIFFLFILPLPVASLEIESGSQIFVDQPKGDLILSGGRVIVGSQIEGDLIVAGGEVDVLGDVAGDVIAAGGRVNVGGNVGGKLIVAGGSVKVDGNVGKFIIASAGEFILTSEVVGDVLVFGGKMENHGVVNGNFTALGGSYANFGTVKGIESFKEVRLLPPYLSEVLALGFLVLGLILLWFDEGFFTRVNSELRVGGKELVKRTVLGFLGLVVAAIIIGLLFVTIVGIPTALVVLATFLIAILLSNLFVAYSIGEVLLSTRKQNAYLYFILGFVILFIAFKIPYVGDIIRGITTSLGFAAIAYVFNDWRIGRKGP
ncbi:MAG: hypothetical protein H0Z28_05695 [Archaeoglobus sp.]|nr:hypothetical protein [Archaeoglobus sp.]